MSNKQWNRAMLEFIPEAGQLELSELLVDLYEFYVLLPRDETPILPAARKVKVTVGRTVVRPEFPIVDDE